MKKIILSLTVIAGVAALVVGGTRAFFSDTETSTGNTFTAGTIDLKIDNSSYYNGQVSTSTSWELADLTVQKFFDFTDLKPGDWGEDTISIHVDDNPAWVCANFKVTKNDDVSCVDPEIEAEGPGICTEPNADMWDGDLGKEIHFAFWADDGDNVLEDNENIILTGTPADLPQGDANTGQTFPIVDSSANPFGNVGDPLPGASTVYVGKAWCFGTLTPSPLPAGQGVNPTIASGVTCDGAPVGNASQTDTVMGDISFSAVQQRNNTPYFCDGRQLPQ